MGSRGIMKGEVVVRRSGEVEELWVGSRGTTIWIGSRGSMSVVGSMGWERVGERACSNDCCNVVIISTLFPLETCLV